MEIRHYQESDWPQMWAMMQPVFAAGETYAYPQNITEQELRHLWLELAQATYVACNEQGEVIGTYYLKANQIGLGAHVANSGYVVAEKARGQGVANALCQHSQQMALAAGFKAMQYNFVVSTNKIAVGIWQKNGFKIAGVLDRAFKLRNETYVDIYVMYKWLAND
ncbi:GNAT family N-acetyltransferase [Thioflexithrix psekupsensis]|uniref:GNAT family N-acetyltransferase n=1 Tax=Thioflexithrix psekupsensis TaxID=1570016 RepID=A0A251X4K0_9GAMM|nr:GNAT family N-acetyltransferase [Thioflexithrix psekupsensis]OUD12072.1 GNAT family N-acetyltransferase [Thioflexithrix psekupsensis]